MKMKITFRIFGTFMLILVSSIQMNGQHASGIPFMFTDSAVTPHAFPSVGNVNVIIPAAWISEHDTMIAPPGFHFEIGCQSYDKFVLSTNGWIALLPSTVPVFPYHIPPSIPNAMPLNQLSNNTTGFPVIAPLWDDLSCNVITYNFNSNTLLIRWNCKWNSQATLFAPLFWLKLDGNNNSITFNYANNATYVPNAPSASIGIAGICPGDFYSVSYSNTGATIDSTAEDTTIGSVARPYNRIFTFTPVSWNDDCSSAMNLGTIDSVCTPFEASTCNAITSGSPNCSTTDVKDVWFSYVKPVGVSTVTIATFPASCESVTGTSMEVYSGCGTSMIGCSINSSSNPTFASVSVVRPDTIAETLYVRVTADGDVPGKFLICAVNDSAITSVDDMDDIRAEIFSSANNLFIDFENFSSNNSYELYNLQGAKIKEGKLSSGRNMIPCEMLSQGVYIVRAMIGNRVISRRILFGE